MTRQPLIWLTRPAADSTSFATELAASNIPNIISPVMHIESLHYTYRWPLESQPTAILITSRHATHALEILPFAAHQTGIIYCVGEATAEAVRLIATRRHWKSVSIIVGDSDALSLLPRICSDLGTGGRLLYLAGEDTRVDVVHLLGAQGVQVHTAIVYQAVAESALGSDVVSALAAGNVTGVTFFSPRSAEIACKLIQATNLADAARSIDAFCFSLNVAAAAGKLAWKNIHACHAPTRHAMRELIVSHATKTL